MKTAKYKIKKQFYLNTYYEVYRKGLFGWKYVTKYDSYEDATKWIEATTDAPVLFDENGHCIS